MEFAEFLHGAERQNLIFSHYRLIKGKRRLKGTGIIDFGRGEKERVLHHLSQ